MSNSDNINEFNELNEFNDFSKKSPIIINIEGNIGVGKSTLTNLIKNRIKDSHVVDEPIDIWLNTKDNNGSHILDNFYNDKNRWSYTFQNFAYISRVMKIEETIKNSNFNKIFLDRSIETDLYVFSKMLLDEGCMNSLEYKIYNYWNEFYYKYVRKQYLQRTIYLRATPQTCFERIAKRGRESEKLISIDYLEKLHKYHDDWLLKADNVLIIDYDDDNDHQNIELDIDYQNKIIGKIEDFIKQ